MLLLLSVLIRTCDSFLIASTFFGYVLFLGQARKKLAANLRLAPPQLNRRKEVHALIRIPSQLLLIID